MGWYTVNSLASNRDRANKKREIQTEYLIGAYRGIEFAAGRKQILPYRESIERAIGDVQLFGTLEQVRLAKQLTAQMNNAHYMDPRPLLVSLRRDLRKELELEPMNEEIVHWRIIGEAP